MNIEWLIESILQSHARSRMIDWKRKWRSVSQVKLKVIDDDCVVCNTHNRLYIYRVHFGLGLSSPAFV